MREKKSLLFFLTICLFVSISFLFLYLAWKEQKTPFHITSQSPPSKVAKVESLKGFAQGLAFLSKKNLPLKKGDILYHQDTLLTEEESQLTLSFRGGWRVRLKEKTHVFLEKSPQKKQRPQYQIHLLKGDLQVLREGKSYPLWIVQKGRSFLAQRAKSLPLMKPLDSGQGGDALNLKNSSSASSLAPPQQGIPNEVIMARLEKKKGAFFLCYKQLLKKAPLSKGKLQVYFLISSKGRITKARIQWSQFQPKENKPIKSFYKCILQKVRKIRFPKFKGEQHLPVLFPLQFS